MRTGPSMDRGVAGCRGPQNTRTRPLAPPPPPHNQPPPPTNHPPDQNPPNDLNPCKRSNLNR